MAADRERAFVRPVATREGQRTLGGGLARVGRSLASWALALVVAVVAPGHASAQINRVPNSTLQMPVNPAATYALQTAFPGVTFAAPLAFATPPGETNRLFVVERAGRIKVIPNLASPTTATFLDISSRVVSSGEQGLLGLAFHPSYSSNGFFYVFYSTTVSGGLRERLSRFKVSTTDLQRAGQQHSLIAGAGQSR